MQCRVCWHRRQPGGDRWAAAHQTTPTQPRLVPAAPPGVGAATISGWPSSSSSQSAHSCGSTPRSGVKQSQSPKGPGSSSCWPAGMVGACQGRRGCAVCQQRSGAWAEAVRIAATPAGRPAGCTALALAGTRPPFPCSAALPPLPPHRTHRAAGTAGCRRYHPVHLRVQPPPQLSWHWPGALAARHRSPLLPLPLPTRVQAAAAAVAAAVPRPTRPQRLPAGRCWGEW